MTQPPALTDRTALARFRNRARRMAEPALFLHHDAALEVQERLTEVNKTFTAPAIVSPFPEIWNLAVPDARHIPDAEVLDLAPEAHDLIIHGLTLHWANDPVGQLIQCRRALKPDGLFIGVMFGGQTLAELRAVLAQAESALTGGLSPRIAPMAEIRDLGGLLQRAGFALPVVDGNARTVTYRDALHLMRDLRAMGEGNALSQRRRVIPPKRLFTDAAQIYANAFPAGNNRISATFETIFLTGWAPHPDQQKPLKPGSATARLADFLGSSPSTKTAPDKPDN